MGYDLRRIEPPTHQLGGQRQSPFDYRPAQVCRDNNPQILQTQEYPIFRPAIKPVRVFKNPSGSKFFGVYPSHVQTNETTTGED